MKYHIIYRLYACAHTSLRLTMKENKVVWPQAPCAQLFKVNLLDIFIFLSQKCFENDLHLVS